MNASERAAERRKKILARSSDRLNYITSGTPLATESPTSDCTASTEMVPMKPAASVCAPVPPTPRWPLLFVALIAFCAAIGVFGTSWLVCSYVILRGSTFTRPKPLSTEQLQRSLVVMMLLPPTLIPAFRLLLRYSTFLLDLCVFLGVWLGFSLVRVLVPN